MYAVISDRGRQYRAIPGQKLTLDRAESAAVGSTLEVPVLLLADGATVKIGAPMVAGVKAVLKVLEHTRGDKGVLVKYMKRKRNLRRHGYRHDHTVVEVVSVG